MQCRVARHCRSLGGMARGHEHGPYCQAAWQGLWLHSAIKLLGGRVHFGLTCATVSCTYRQAAWRRDFNAAITVVISLLTERFPVVKLLGGRGVVGMVLSKWLMALQAVAVRGSWALFVGLEQDADVTLRRKCGSNWSFVRRVAMSRGLLCCGGP